MAIQNIECHLATVLMKRFLDGENLPQDILNDLERHIKVCPSCRDIVNNEKVSLEEVLDGPKPKKGFAAVLQKFSPAPVQTPAYAGAGASGALLQASQVKVSSTPPGMAAFKNPKVLMLSGALAVVLILMSTILRDPTKMLGPKATNGLTATAEKKDESKDEATSEDHKSEDEHAASDEHSTTDEHAATDEHATDDAHATEDTHAADESHAAEGDHDPVEDSHTPPATDTHAPTKEEQIKAHNDPNVPGKKTVDTSDIMIAGGSKSSTTTEHKEEPKAQAPERKTTTSTKRTPTRKTSTSKKSTSAPAKKSSGGIKVYDKNGNPIK
ncbi:MAG: hypothetical protein KDC26_06795 [Armatimonadetes bacterium]|nr:hypothetical protein [Armatimonadota bacterium]